MFSGGVAYVSSVSSGAHDTGSSGRSSTIGAAATGGGSRNVAMANPRGPG